MKEPDRIVRRHRATILAALYLASEYESSLYGSSRGFDIKYRNKAKRSAAKYLRLRSKLMSAWETPQTTNNQA